MMYFVTSNRVISFDSVSELVLCHSYGENDEPCIKILLKDSAYSIECYYHGFREARETFDKIVKAMEEEHLMVKAYEEISPDCFKEIKGEPGEFLKEQLKEESAMYTDLEITFKSGETITYSKGEWDDYSYDGKAVAVKKDGAWVGIYNFDNVFCVELKNN